MPQAILDSININTSTIVITITMSLAIWNARNTPDVLVYLLRRTRSTISTRSADLIDAPLAWTSARDHRRVFEMLGPGSQSEAESDAFYVRAVKQQAIEPHTML